MTTERRKSSRSLLSKLRIQKEGIKINGRKKGVGHGPRDRIAVIGKEEQKLRTTPTAKIECPKCRNNLTYT